MTDPLPNMLMLHLKWPHLKSSHSQVNQHQNGGWGEATFSIPYPGPNTAAKHHLKY